MSKRNVRRVRLDDPDDDRIENADPPRGNNENILLRAGAGRPSGSTNLVPKSVKGMVLQVMEMRGSDGKGTDGALGWLADLDKNHKHLFVQLLRRMLPVQLRAELEPGSLMAKLLQTAAAARTAREGNANGAGNGRLIDVTPSRRSYAEADDER